MTWCQFGAVFIVCPEKIHLRYILGEIKHTRDARQALEINRQLISQELHIFQYILIRELSRAEVLGEGEKLGNKHGGKVSWRWFGDKVLNDDFWLMPIFQECKQLTRKVATTTRITFSFTAACATSTRRGIISYFLWTYQKPRSSKRGGNQPGALINLICHLLLKWQQPKAKGNLVAHLWCWSVFQCLHKPVTRSIDIQTNPPN